jgi:hypothetical protein
MDTNLPLLQSGSEIAAMSAPKDDLLRAIELALAGKWDAAHQLVQQYEDDATAAWIHAVLHKTRATAATPAIGIAAPTRWAASKMNRARNWPTSRLN